MVFTPHVTSNEDRWRLNPSLPIVKYQQEGRIKITDIVADIIQQLPVKSFSDHVVYYNVTKQLLEQVWPRWEEYFHPSTQQAFLHLVQRRIKRDGAIIFENINQSHTREAGFAT